MQEDSNGDTFEIIDKRTEELSLAADKAGTIRHLTCELSPLVSCLFQQNTNHQFVFYCLV